MGLASRFAGGKGTLDQTLSDIAFGALVGAVVGGALGGAQYALVNGSPPTAPNLNPGQSPIGPQPDPSGGIQNPPPGTTNSLLSGLAKAASPWFSYYGQFVGCAILASPFASASEALVVDNSSGILDLGYGPQILQLLEHNSISVSAGGKN
jgi:hypothetical protein